MLTVETRTVNTVPSFVSLESQWYVEGVTTMGDECNPVEWICYHSKYGGSYNIMEYIYKIENLINEQNI